MNYIFQVYYHLHASNPDVHVIFTKAESCTKVSGGELVFESNFNPSNPTRKENEDSLHKKRGGKLNSFVGRKNEEVR